MHLFLGIPWLVVFILSFVKTNRTNFLSEIVAKGEYPVACSVRNWNFTYVRTDINGKKCRRNISTTACYGSCDTFEYGSRDFPHTNGRQTVCNYNRVRELTVLLSDCDPGVKLKTTNFTYVEALSCICNRCDPKTTLCLGKD